MEDLGGRSFEPAAPAARAPAAHPPPPRSFLPAFADAASRELDRQVQVRWPCLESITHSPEARPARPP